MSAASACSPVTEPALRERVAVRRPEGQLQLPLNEPIPLEPSRDRA
jgi:hypothetical protein